MAPSTNVRLSRRGVLAGLVLSAVASCQDRPASGNTLDDDAPLTPEQFGAKGDGISDDQPAFDALNQYLARNDGGSVRLREGAVYLAGKQTPGANGYHQRPEAIIGVENVSSLIVDLNGATLKFRSGLKFGSFDPRSGAPHRGSAPSKDRSLAAQIGWGIKASNVKFVHVRNGVIEMNSQGAVLGGEWGDTGRQLAHYGVAAYECERVILEDVHVRNSCLDGFLFEYSGLSENSGPKPFVIRGCTADKVARNCLSITGANQALVQNCEFSRAGEADNIRLGGSFGSNPKSCLDVEAEGSICRNIVIRNSKMLSGRHSHSAFVADSGDAADILLEDCHLSGIVWTRKPRTVFRNCVINGVFGRILGGQQNSRDNTLIDGCRISDKPWGQAAAPVSGIINGEGSGSTPTSRAVIRNSTFDIHYHAANIRWLYLENVTFNVFAGIDTMKPGQYLALMDFSHVRGMQVNDRIPTAKAPAIAYYLHGAENADVSDAVVNSPSGRIHWIAALPARGGYAGRYKKP